MENRHSQSIPESVVQQAEQQLIEAIRLLKPYCPVLTAKERQSIPKMSDENLSFGEKSLVHGINHPEFLPSHVNIDDWKVDMADVAGTKSLAALVGDLTQMLTDVRMLAGSEAYFAGRALYHNVKRAAEDGVAGAKPIYDDLKGNFKVTKGKG